MSRYLVIANQTAVSDELTQFLIEKAEDEPGSEFVLVVPATPVEHLLTQEEGQAKEIAARRAGMALTHLTEARVPIAGAHVGAASLNDAIDEALFSHVADYKGIIICTFPEGVSRWLRPGLANSLETAFHLPVTHVVAIHGHLMGSGRQASPVLGIMRSF